MPRERLRGSRAPRRALTLLQAAPESPVLSGIREPHAARSSPRASLMARGPGSGLPTHLRRGECDVAAIGRPNDVGDPRAREPDEGAPSTAVGPHRLDRPVGAHVRNAAPVGRPGGRTRPDYPGQRPEPAAARGENVEMEASIAVGSDGPERNRPSVGRPGRKGDDQVIDEPARRATLARDTPQARAPDEQQRARIGRPAEPIGALGDRGETMLGATVATHGDQTWSPSIGVTRERESLSIARPGRTDRGTAVVCRAKRRPAQHTTVHVHHDDRRSRRQDDPSRAEPGHRHRKAARAHRADVTSADVHQLDHAGSRNSLSVDTANAFADRPNRATVGRPRKRMVAPIPVCELAHLRAIAPDDEYLAIRGKSGIAAPTTAERCAADQSEPRERLATQGHRPSAEVGLQGAQTQRYPPRPAMATPGRR